MKLQQLQIFQNLTEEELEKKSCLFTGCSKEISERYLYFPSG